VEYCKAYIKVYDANFSKMFEDCKGDLKMA